MKWKLIKGKRAIIDQMQTKNMRKKIKDKRVLRKVYKLNGKDMYKTVMMRRKRNKSKMMMKTQK